jgi:hypothetical protein
MTAGITRVVWVVVAILGVAAADFGSVVLLIESHGAACAHQEGFPCSEFVRTASETAFSALTVLLVGLVVFAVAFR